MAERPEYILELPVLGKYGYRPRLGIVVSSLYERVQKPSVAIVDPYFWNWVYLYPVIPEKLVNLKNVVLKFHQEYLPVRPSRD